MLEPNALRTERKANHRRKLAALKNEKWIEQAEKKRREGYALTGRLARVYREHAEK